MVVSNNAFNRTIIELKLSTLMRYIDYDMFLLIGLS